jgi:thymidine kinase
MAKLHFKYGAMNSGKSTALLNTAYNYTERGLDVATLKPSVDTKGDRMIVARAGLSREVDILATPGMNIRQEIQNHMDRKAIEQLHAVLIDEAQFLQPEQVNQLHETAVIDGISVIAYGLRTDFRTNLFPGSMRLFELATNLEKLPTMCRCNKQAEFNCRQQNGQFVFEGNQVAIDGEGETTYDSLCGDCYIQERAKNE